MSFRAFGIMLLNFFSIHQIFRCYEMGSNLLDKIHVQLRQKSNRALDIIWTRMLCGLTFWSRVNFSVGDRCVLFDYTGRVISCYIFPLVMFSSCFYRGIMLYSDDVGIQWIRTLQSYEANDVSYVIEFLLMMFNRTRCLLVSNFR